MFKGLGGITDESPSVIIAEACENHLGSLEVAVEMIRQAHACGANFIKFQHHLRDAEMIRGLKMTDNFGEDLYDFLGRCSLTIDQHVFLAKQCDEYGIGYLCTPFCLEAAEELHDHNLCSTVKIGSGEMLDFRLLGWLARENIPMVVSTGMSTLFEIDKAVDFLRNQEAEFALLHCVSEYPPVDGDVYLDTITDMKARYGDITIGFSCHTPNPYSSYGAVTLGAKIIEKHFTLDRNVACPDQAVSLEPSVFSTLVNGIRSIESSRGIKNDVLYAEQGVREWARRIVVAKRDLDAFETLTQDNITVKRAGKGACSSLFHSFIGKTLAKPVLKDKPILVDDIR